MAAQGRNSGEDDRGRFPIHPVEHPDSTMVLYADGVEAVVHVNHLTWALSDPATGSDNVEWLQLKLKILKREGVPASAAGGLRQRLEDNAPAVARAAVAAERSMAGSVRSGVHHEVPAFAAAYSARQLCQAAAEWFGAAIAAGGSLHIGWIVRSAPDAPRLVSDEAALLRWAIPS